MTIRQLRIETEREMAVPILRQLWSDADPAEILAWTGEDAYHLFGRFDNDELVAVAGALISNLLHHTRHAWIYDLAVDRPRRTEGHGTALIEHIEQWAEDNDCESISLASPLQKDNVHRYYENREYEKWGYVIEKEL